MQLQDKNNKEENEKKKKTYILKVPYPAHVINLWKHPQGNKRLNK